MPLTKCEGLNYPTHFLKSRGSVIWNNFLEYRTKQATPFARRNDYFAVFATIKAKPTLKKSIFCAPVVTQFIVKVLRKIEKSPIFESLPFLYQSTFSECKGVSRASSDSIMYFYKKLSWHQIVNLSNHDRK